MFLNKLEDARKRVFRDTVSNPLENSQNAPSSTMQAPSILRQEFEISGQIGDQAIRRATSNFTGQGSKSEKRAHSRSF